MTRRLFHLLSAASLVGLVAILYLWATSYYHYRLFSHGGRVLVLAVEPGGGTDTWLRKLPPTADDWHTLRQRAPSAGGDRFEYTPLTSWPNFAFSYTSGSRDITMFAQLRYWLLAVPYWPLAVAAAVLPLAWLVVAARTRRRDQAGLCPGCGYDLRATPEKGGALLDRCPECGAVPAAPSA